MKRKLVQVISAVLYNLNIGGFLSGSIYKGDLKGVCAPGLNCYSCPGAVVSCPLGALQMALVSSRYKVPLYALGLVLLLGVLLGRFICGFLCPVGLAGELLYKIPTKKIHKNKITRIFSYLKYILLIVLVVLIPIVKSFPAFCEYICPAGTLEAGIPLVSLDSSLRRLLGTLFSWKVFVLALCIIGSIFFYRFFCRFLCPLGAFYSLFNKIAITRMVVDENKCSHCGKCKETCLMDIKSVGDRECVQCGECIKTCSCKAIERKKSIRNGAKK